MQPNTWERVWPQTSKTGTVCEVVGGFCMGLVSLLCGPPESSFDADRVVGFEIIGIMTEQEGQLRPV